jgi:hypothetical protein
MQYNKAIEHYSQIINEVLRPAQKMVQTSFINRKVLELSDVKTCITSTGLVDFTYSWDAGGYQFLTSSADPGGIVTSDYLRSTVERDYFLGATNARGDSFSPLDFMTDIDTWHYLAKEDPILKDAWRFGTFNNQAKEFYEYGFRGFAGDHLVKTLFMPLRFNKVSSGRYQQVLPYANGAVTSGIGDTFNADFGRALYQMSFKVNSNAIQMMPFRASPVNPKMPFRIRDYAGNWFWTMNDLPNGLGGTIPNPRNNKGMFMSDFDIGVRPAHTEWLTTVFHKRMPPCVTIIDSCASDPGSPSQNYNMANATCEFVTEFVLPKGEGTFTVAANSITCDGNPVTHSQATGASLTALVNSLNSVATYFGDWAVVTDTADTLLAITDLAAVGGSATVTSATGGFTSAMVGQTLWIKTAGTGSHFSVGYYTITAYTSTNSITVDRVVNDGTAGVAGTADVVTGQSIISVTGDCQEVSLPVTLA